MKKLLYIVMLLILIAVLTACLSDEVYDVYINDDEIIYVTPIDDEFISGDPIEWGQITSFSARWGDFHGGHQSFQIEKIGDEYFFNTTGEMGVQFFVPADQVIASYNVEELQNILESNNMDSWNGFRGRLCDYCTSDWGFSLEFEVDTGYTISMTAACNSPSGFSYGFAELSAFLFSLSDQYMTEPEWGNLEFFQFRYRTIWPETTYTLRLFDGDVVFIDGDGGSWLVEDEALEDLYQLMIEYGIDQWWDGHREEDTGAGSNAIRFNIWVQYDNDTEFSTWGVSPRDRSNPNRRDHTVCDATNALLYFFRNIGSYTISRR